MDKSWDYADLSKLASAHGGSQELLKKYAELYMKKGFSEGFKKGAASKLLQRHLLKHFSFDNQLWQLIYFVKGISFNQILYSK